MEGTWGGGGGGLGERSVFHHICVNFTNQCGIGLIYYYYYYQFFI